MKSKNDNLMFYISLVIFPVYAVVSLFLNATLAPLPVLIPLVILLDNIKKRNKFDRAFLVMLTYLLSVLSSFLPSLTFPSLVKAYADSLFILPLLVLVDEDEKDRSFSVISLILFGIVSWITLSVTNNSYYYLYGGMENYGEYVVYSRLLYFVTLSIPVVELLFNSKRNYLSFFLLLASSVIAVLAATAKGESNPILTPTSWYYLLILFIYIGRVEDEVVVTDRKKIVLTKLDTHDIEHLRKKKKPRIYEIPPNLPLDDRPGKAGE